MENEPGPEALVAGIKERLREGGVGTIQIWGSHAVRPSDQIYEVKDVSFHGGVLRVVLFLALDGKDRVVEVDEPRGAKVSKAGLLVQDAARVRVFGQEYSPPGRPTGPALHLGL